MYKGVYDTKMLVVLPLAVLFGGIILLLTVGPILVRRAYQKKGLEPPSLASRYRSCFFAACAIFFSLHIGLYVSVIFCAVFVLLCVVLPIFLVPLSARLCVPPASHPDSPHPLGKRRVFSFGILAAACVVAFWISCIPSLKRMSFLAVESVYGMNMNGIGKGLSLYETQYKSFPDHLGQLVDEGFVSYKSFRLPYNRDRFDAVYEQHKEGEPFKAPPDFHYIKLPKDTPGNLLCVWPDPQAYEGDRFYVLYVSGSIKRLMPDELPAEIKKTNDWLEKHQPTSRPKATGK